MQTPFGTGRRTIFNPPLSTQRYCWVQRFIENEVTIKRVTDVGCGNGRMLNWLKTIGHLEVINCIDKDSAKLEYEMENYFKPNLTEMLFGRKNSDKKLDINVFQGDIAVPDDRLSSDCFSLVEMIEHISLEHVERIARAVFGYYHPKYVIITTPNSEFNKLLRQDGDSSSKFRHHDHKFEWTRQEFIQWAEGICSKFPYGVKFDGVGHLPGSESYGPCTQIALFTRAAAPNPKCETDLNCLDLFIDKLSVEKGTPEFSGDRKLKRICLMTKFELPGGTPSQENDDSSQVNFWGNMDYEEVESASIQ